MYPDIFTNFTIKRPLSNKERKILDTIILKSYSTKHDIRFNCTNNQYSITLTYKHSENKIKVKRANAPKENYRKTSVDKMDQGNFNQMLLEAIKWKQVLILIKFCKILFADFIYYIIFIKNKFFWE